MIKDTSQTDRVIMKKPAWYQRPPLRYGALGGGLLALVVFGVAHWSTSAFSINSDRLRFADVQRGLLIRDVNVNGRVVAADSATLYASATGTVTLKHRAGDTVQQGDVLAELDSPELTNELQREQSTLQRLSSEFSRQKIEAERLKLAAVKEADEASLALLAAERDWQRIASACAAQVIAKLDCLEREDAVKSASIRDQHAAKEAELEAQSVEFELATRKQEVARQTLVVQNLMRRVDELKLRAPFNGIVGSVAIADRAVLPINSPIMTLVDLSRLDVELSVPESYAEDLGLDMQVEVQLGNAQANGRILAISPEVTDNQVLVRVRLDNESQVGIRQNQRVSARILFEEKPNVLLVQRGPFVEADGGRFAYVVEGNTAMRRPVTLGATSVNAVEIIEGLKENERIVISGTENFERAERIQLN
ncbi:efflux RND transporter periplasmic adaptor subunit [Permianibacter aggregans]|uniref:HlyD family secretion protein n=1 Tax=Permianibacter aggregans TaxID=1510150 RepID=A0A4R6UMN3_9GAMM|nr:efflux RND transporter periplasmic adaptor subunit [Permianibacter aggregans]QGX41113.1 efflux RND transporter periplasmic adaptor subunit [Permianibacter aggregans]TDQ48181.1 HlyD family secretion protein [Permianibacter aggregans]